jgi:hypothetical protein
MIVKRSFVFLCSLVGRAVRGLPAFIMVEATVNTWKVEVGVEYKLMGRPTVG